MGMRIRTNVASLQAQRNLLENAQKQNDSLERLASGYRINKSADDAAGLAISESLRGKIRSLNVAKRNANDGISLIQIAEGSMNEMSNIVIRLRELTAQAASDTLGGEERSYLNREYTQLVQEVDRIGKTAEFNNIKLFDTGGREQFVIQVGTNGLKDGDTSATSPDTIAINLKGLKFSMSDLNLGTENEIGYKENPSSAPSREEISKKLGTIDDALARFANERATLGAIQSRLNSALNNLGVSSENLSTAKSRIKDVDFAEESTQLTQAKVLLASNTSVLAQANQAPEMALQLLRS